MKRNCTSICSFFFSSFVVQFSRYIRFSLRFYLPFGKLVYYTTDFCVCQVLFESFFNFFQVLVFHPLFSVAVVLQRPLYYITKFSVCQGVLENFLKSFSTSFSLNRLFKFPLAFGDLCSIPLLSPFVNTFHQLFWCSMFFTNIRQFMSLKMCINYKLAIFIILWYNMLYTKLQESGSKWTN